MHRTVFLQDVSVSDRPRALLFCFGGLLAGICNGLLGTGGGILIVGVLRLERRLRSSDRPSLSGRKRDAVGNSPKDDYVTALCCMLPLSLLSSILCLRASAFSGVPFSSALPYLLGAVPGGVFGAYLLDRMKPKTAQLLFTALVLLGGARMAFS